MKALMKAKKNIAGMRFCISADALVNATAHSEAYSISPLGHEELTLPGIPIHYLVKGDHVVNSDFLDQEKSFSPEH